MEQIGAIAELIDALKKLPGVGPRAAQRIAYQLLNGDRSDANRLGEELLKATKTVHRCARCNNLTERHARALLRLEGEEARAAALEVILQRSMNVAQTEEYIESFLQAAQPKAKPRRPSFIIKDVRLFLNSINHSMDVMRRAGVDAKCGREETEDTITLTICIPKNKTAPIA